jgi:4-hydroxy-tetrahydrodipicolinate synthase
MKKFSGTGVAIVTPFKSDSSIDFLSLSNLVDFLVKNKVNYLVVLGTTGESVTQAKKEKRAVIDCVIEANDNRIPVVVGIGGNNTLDIVKKLKICRFDDIDGILSVAPYYNKPGQKGIYQHYKTIAEHSAVPVIVYNVPGRTGINITAETTLKLAHDFSTIIAIKEASGNLEQIGTIIRDSPDDFLVISGDDAITLPLIALGGDGVISVLANAYPKEWSEMVTLALTGKYDAAREIHYRFTDLIRALFIEGNPAGIKAVMSNLGLAKNYLRLPLTPVSRGTYSNITRLVEEIEAVRK